MPILLFLNFTPSIAPAFHSGEKPICGIMKICESSDDTESSSFPCRDFVTSSESQDVVTRESLCAGDSGSEIAKAGAFLTGFWTSTLDEEEG